MGPKWWFNNILFWGKSFFSQAPRWQMTPACVSRQSLSSHRKSTFEKSLSSKNFLFCSKSTQGRQTSRAIRAQSWKFSPTAGAPAAQDVKLASLIECCQTHLHIGVVIGCLISQVNVDFEVRTSFSYALLKKHIPDMFTFPLEAVASKSLLIFSTCPHGSSQWVRATSRKPRWLGSLQKPSSPGNCNSSWSGMRLNWDQLALATLPGNYWLWPPYQVHTGFGGWRPYQLIGQLVGVGLSQETTNCLASKVSLRPVACLGNISKSLLYRIFWAAETWDAMKRKQLRLSSEATQPSGHSMAGPVLVVGGEVVGEVVGGGGSVVVFVVGGRVVGSVGGAVGSAEKQWLNTILHKVLIWLSQSQVTQTYMIHKWDGPARQSLHRWGLVGHQRSEPWGSLMNLELTRFARFARFTKVVTSLVNLDLTRFATWNPISSWSPTSWGPSQSKLLMSQWIWNVTMSPEFKWVAYISVQSTEVFLIVYNVYIVWWWGFSNVAVEPLQWWLKLKMYGPAGHLQPMWGPKKMKWK